jgi:hypothetical protein
MKKNIDYGLDNKISLLKDDLIKKNKRKRDKEINKVGDDDSSNQQVHSNDLRADLKDESYNFSHEVGVDSSYEVMNDDDKFVTSRVFHSGLTDETFTNWLDRELADFDYYIKIEKHANKRLLKAKASNYYSNYDRFGDNLYFRFDANMNKHANKGLLKASDYYSFKNYDSFADNPLANDQPTGEKEENAGENDDSFGDNLLANDQPAGEKEENAGENDDSFGDNLLANDQPAGEKEENAGENDDSFGDNVVENTEGAPDNNIKESIYNSEDDNNYTTDENLSPDSTSGKKQNGVHLFSMIKQFFNY